MSELRIAENLTLDLPRLVDSRMLVAANSGGGKSWLFRLVAEQAAGHVQVVILDPEGEFASLRERHDFLLVGREGELPAETRSAGLLARRLLELQASAVLDLYDLRLPDRRRYVRLFLESLMALPKACWRPLLVLIDESHHFCPERSAGDAESTNAVIDLMSQGRKRGYCGALATQRLSKLHKDAEAECNNVFIGRTWLDIDQQRAGNLLGMDKAARGELRDLPAGEFFAFGPAVSTPGVSRFRSAAVRTTHPKAGQRHKFTPPKPSEAVGRLVVELKDLPQQADAEANDLASAKKQIADLRRQLAARPVESRTVEVEKVVEVPVLKNGQLERTEKIIDRLAGIGDKVVSEAAELRRLIAPAAAPRQPVPVRPAVVLPRPVSAPRSEGTATADPAVGTGGLRRMLIALAQRPGLTNRQIGLRATLSSQSGTFSTYLGRARSAGWIRDEGERRFITEEGVAALGDYTPLPEGRALLDHWLNELGNSGAARMLRAYADAYPDGLTNEQCGEKAGISAASGTFSTYLGRLRGLELVEGRGVVRASAELFD